MNRLALPSLLVLGLLAGCGGSGSSTQTPSAQADPTGVVQAASDTTAEAGSSRFQTTTVSTISGKDLTTTSTGAFDPDKRVGQIDITIAQAGQAGATIQERVLGDDLYIADPTQQGSYYHLSVSDLVGTSFASGADPTASFQALKAASAGVTKVGAEQVRGEDTTHYRGTFDETAALAKVSGAAKDLLTAAFKGSDVTAVPFDAWVDGQGRLRRVVQTLTLSPGGSSVKTTSTTEVFDFGSAVQVSAPPAAQVKDGAPLLSALKSTATS